MRKLIIFIALLMVSSMYLKAQDKIYFKTYNYNESFYYSQILTGIQQFENPKKTKNFKRVKVDISGKKYPNKVADYNKQWYLAPISQGNAGSCWAYSTTSFLESDIYRMTKQKVDLSEIWTVYWEYVEKAKGFVNSRGTTIFEEGSEANAVTKIYKKYGIVPQSAYTGLLAGQKYHSHQKLKKEMDSYLAMVKKNNIWNEDQVLSTIKSLLNHYLGTPPTQVKYNGKTYSPKDYMTNVLKLNPNDYVDILSYKQANYWEQCSYDVPDNWWKDKSYYNVPLNDFMDALKKAVKAGYTFSIGGDVSEPGLLSDKGDPQIAIIPTFDIASDKINDDARQFRFSNKTTTDDHGMHCVGFLEKDGEFWFLIKDSSSGSRNNFGSDRFGYYFFNENYVKLKMMDFMIHKDAVKDLLKKFK